MGSIKTMAATLAVSALIVAACAAEQDTTGSPGIDQPATQQPGQATPGGPGEASPDMGGSPDVGGSPDIGGSPDAGMSPGAGASPDGDTGLGSPSPAATTGPGGEAGTALAVLDHSGTRTVLEDGQCQLTQPEQPTDTIAGQPAEGSSLQLQFEQSAEGASLDLTIELSRGFAVEEPAEESPSPGLGSPSPAASPLITGEDILPFTVLPEQVELSLQLPGQEVGAQPEVLTGSVAPNGVNGYLITRTEQGELLTINFVCAQPEDAMGAPGASPAASPGAGESPATEPSPSP